MRRRLLKIVSDVLVSGIPRSDHYMYVLLRRGRSVSLISNKKTTHSFCPDTRLGQRPESKPLTVKLPIDHNKRREYKQSEKLRLPKTSRGKGMTVKMRTTKELIFVEKWRQ